MLKISKIVSAACLALLPAAAHAAVPLNYEAKVLANVSTGDFAPYFIGSLNHGKTVRANALALDARATVQLDSTSRFSWGAGAEFVFDISSANDYARYLGPVEQWGEQSNRPAYAWVQQLYGEIKYRSLFARLGQKDYHSALLDETLSSGDLTRSANARGIPGLEIGFIDFQDIPFTNGWVQIQGVIEYGRTTDDGFKRKQYNYYNYLLATDLWFTYKRCYFRTNPAKPLSVTIGMQAAGQFAGSTAFYKDGKYLRSDDRGFHIKDVFKMFLPTEGNGNDFYEGNTLGSWDLKARYRLRNGDELSFVFQGPWEDGSGIGRMNGADGLWGLYFHSHKPALISAAGIEYLDFTNQSGPMHWAPADAAGTSITSHASGRDNYYNNVTYGAYTNYGMAIATPFLVAPIYNLNGFPAFRYNRAQGMHIAIRGYLATCWTYALKYSWQHATQSGNWPSRQSMVDNSMLARLDWLATALAPGLRMSASLAFDAGRLRGNNFGALVSVSYSGDFTFNRNRK